MELINKLGIDWKLLVAQIVNFFILLVVLYKFVYKPVLHTLEKRSKIIEKGMRDAKESEEKLLQVEHLQKTRLAETEKEIGRLFETAKNDAEVLKKNIIEKATSEVQDLLKRTRLQLEEEKQKMIQEVKRELGSFVVQATGKLLEREISPADQKRLMEAIVKEMTHSL